MAQRETVFVLFTLVVLAVLGGMIYLLVFDDNGESITEDPTLQEESRAPGDSRTETDQPETGPAEQAEEASENPDVSFKPAEREAIESEFVDIYSWGQIHGRVVDEEGQSLAGVDVILFHQSLSRNRMDIDPVVVEETLREVSDSQGEFLFSNVPPLGGFTVIAEKKGYIPRNRPTVKVVPGHVKDAGDLVMGRGWTLSGTVRDLKSNPIPKATVFVEIQNKQIPVLNWEGPAALMGDQADFKSPASLYLGKKKVLTDENGQYLFEGLGAGNFFVGAWAKDYAMVIDKTVTAGKTSEFKNQEINFILEPGQVISGSVIDQDGKPVAGVKVRAERQGSTRDYSLGITKSAKGDGRFSITGLHPGTYFLRVSAEGYLPSIKNNIKTGNTQVILDIKRAAMIHGKVLAHDTKKPLTIPFAVTYCPYHSTAAEIKQALRKWEPQQNAAGAFQIEGVQRGHYVVAARAEGYSMAYSDPINPIEGQEVGPIYITLGRAYTLTGSVSDGTGKPVAGARVSVFKGVDSSEAVRKILGMEANARREADKEIFPSTITGKKGAFLLNGLAPGVYSLKVSHPEFQDATLYEVGVKAADKNYVGEIALLQGGSLEGHVRAADGSPQADILVRINGSEPGQFYFARTDANGGFKVVKMAPGQYDVVIQKPRSTVDFMSNPGESKITINVVEGQPTTLEHQLP